MNNNTLQLKYRLFRAMFFFASVRRISSLLCCDVFNETVRLGVKEENLPEYYRRKEETYRKVGRKTSMVPHTLKPMPPRRGEGGGCARGRFGSHDALGRAPVVAVFGRHLRRQVLTMPARDLPLSSLSPAKHAAPAAAAGSGSCRDLVKLAFGFFLEYGVSLMLLLQCAEALGSVRYSLVLWLCLTSSFPCSCRVLPCPLTWFDVCLFLSCHVSTFLFVSWLAISCLSISYLAISFLFVSSLAISCLAISYLVLNCCISSRLVFPYLI